MDILAKRYASLYRTSETVQGPPALYPNYPSPVETQVNTQTLYSDAALTVANEYGALTKHVTHLRQAVQETQGYGAPLSRLRPKP